MVALSSQHQQQGDDHDNNDNPNRENSERVCLQWYHRNPLVASRKVAGPHLRRPRQFRTALKKRPRSLGHSDHGLLWCGPSRLLTQHSNQQNKRSNRNARNYNAKCGTPIWDDKRQHQFEPTCSVLRGRNVRTMLSSKLRNRLCPDPLRRRAKP